MSRTKADKAYIESLVHQVQRETEAATTLRNALAAAKTELHARLRAEQHRAEELLKLNETLRDEKRTLQGEVYNLEAHKRELETTRTELARAHKALVSAILKDR